ncbi:2,3-bisphosphoglycerate-independent phosphoglycerate mutase [candidate division KSB1 bacterium]|nr:2,3-bisphosphoglycerate-independent phosphoglycerate mutase [candidate division KSB1 bacterium]
MSLKLNKLPYFAGRPGPLLLIIMDGIGIGKNDGSNAVYLANTPTLDRLLLSPSQTRLKTHGPSVGMPGEDDMGNSEVGHNAIGAGRVFDQGAKLVNLAIESGSIFRSDHWREIIRRGKSGAVVHFIGLLSDGNVHSHIDHLFALIKECAANNIHDVRVHTLTDGRDVGGRSALSYLKPTEELLKTLSGNKGLDYKIASGGGRMKVTMDRYNADWSIVKRGWEAHVHGIGRKFGSASEAVQTYYDEDPQTNDQYLDPFVITDEYGEPVGKISDGDAVVFFHFRGDRAIELSKAFENKEFNEFDRGKVPDVYYTGMLEYDGDLKLPEKYLVPPPAIDRTVSEYLCAEKVTSFAISETQKFGHVTYFWNGNRSGYIDESLETYVEIPSDKVPFDQKPNMKAFEITEKTIELLKSGKYRFGRVNFPNADMVGHTGVIDATVTAVEAVDKCVGELLEVIAKIHGIAIVTADHGNSDEMYIIKNGEKVIKTSHSLNLVPFHIVDPHFQGEYKLSQTADTGLPGLTHITGTILNLLGYENVADYDDSLIEFY